MEKVKSKAKQRTTEPRPSVKRRKPQAGTKWVYAFSEGHGGMRDLLGGKGAGLAEMTRAGLPVPPGFTITTEACNTFYSAGKEFPPGMWDQTLEALKMVEKETGKTLGFPASPLLLSVRSGSKFSMPGMMDTVLNLGLNDDTLKGLIELTQNSRFAYDAYRRFIQMFGRIVMGIDASHFERVWEEYKSQTGVKRNEEPSPEHLDAIVLRFKALVKEKTGTAFPTDPYEQLGQAIKAVFASWNNKRAIDYRNFNRIPHNLGTAINVQIMVFGNLGEDSGTGVAFTRDPSTGEKVLYGEYLINAQGEDVVAGIRTPKKLSQLADDMPRVYHQFAEIAKRLETRFRDAQDLEFTVERGKLYMLQTRSAKRSAPAAVKMAVDMANEGLISREEALQRVEPTHVVQLLLPRFDEGAKGKAVQEGRLLAVGLNASPGACSGKAVFDASRAEEMGLLGENVVLVRPETSPDDVHGIIRASGVLTARGGATSHAAVVTRGLGKPCVAGCESITVDPERRLFTVDGKITRENDIISIDGTSGQVFQGAIPTIATQFTEQKDLVTLLQWANQVKRLGVWANADYPRDAKRAVEFGAEGIGLCRTEHMFFEEERLPIVRQMILAAPEAASAIARGKETPALLQYRIALEKLLAFQVSDFKGIFQAMGNRPVIIRLLDPPLHEFLPRFDDLLRETLVLRLLERYPELRKEETYRWFLDEKLLDQETVQRLRAGDTGLIRERQDLLRTVDSMREANPMMGLRGCRLGLIFPGLNEMQVRAIMIAACALAKEGVDVHPEIMIPLVGHANELQIIRQQLDKVASQVQEEMGIKVPYKFGTMIEVPRAALTADAIAQYAEFFSFGTNDLTQTTYGYSRDDAEGKFLLQYVNRKILPDNPFQVLDREGVGKLMEMAVSQGRKTRPDLEVGICGEHGGDPSSIEFCHRLGLNYVSASPFRVPVARLAAAQAALASAEKDR
ncbi:MAG: pyruvate, phosphate dikinase [Chloroflexi bacterium]|nr:pyruvate, phosphate dikinase [Chloroflexota bacterium]